MAAKLAEHQHGKSRVRVARTWREGNVHHFVEWNVQTTLESDMAHSFIVGTNTDMTATDTQKNTVYYVAKQCSSRCSVEEYAIALAKHFVAEYPKVWKAKVYVEQKPWQRIDVQGRPHNHGFAVTGTEVRTTLVTVDKAGKVEVTSGFRDLQVLKTTQSGYVGFLHDKYTMLPDVRDRILATSVTATWKYRLPVHNFDANFDSVKRQVAETFFGTPDKGVYSPSVQYTMYQMGKAVIEKVPQVDSIFFNLPNLHFLPCNPVTSKFEDDVYIATSEPHGNIECVVTRDTAAPHNTLWSKL